MNQNHCIINFGQYKWQSQTGWSLSNVHQIYLFDRGYTGHEHLDAFSLINMNGRMYDPWLGRMLSPDPFLQEPENSQNYNRYSYALNNPLKYTDPSGYNPVPKLWGNLPPGLPPYPGDGAGLIGGLLSGFRPASGWYYSNYSNSIFVPINGVGGGQHIQYYWSQQYYSHTHNQMFMTNRAYNNLYSPSNGYWVDGSRINNVTYDFGNGVQQQLQEVEIYSKFVWTNFNQFRIGNNDAKGVSNWAKGVSTGTNIAGIFVSASQGTIQSSILGSNIAYAISGNAGTIKAVTNGFKYAPYIGLIMTVGTGYYLSTHIDPATNQIYQSWAETGTDIGANIGAIYLGGQYGGWIGAGAATLYMIDKAAFNAYINTVRENPDWVLSPYYYSFTH